MMRWFGLLLLTSACSEQEFNFEQVPVEIPPLYEIRGQACDAEAQVWLEGATVYTHLYDENGVVYDTRTDITDGDGLWVLTDLPSDRTYQIYVAYRNDLVETFEVQLGDTGDVELPPPACFGDVDMTVAVVTGAYDDLELLFANLGIGVYHEVDGQAGSELQDFLANPDRLAEYQIVFFDGGHLEEGVIYPPGDPVVDANLQNLRDYVANGGVVFASDWAYDVVEQGWPGKLDFYGDDTVLDAAQKGEPGDVQALVADEFMSASLGLSQVTVTYDKSVYPVVDAVVDANVRVYLDATIPWREGQTQGVVPDSPVAFSFDQGAGRVYYTNYRNAANAAGDMLTVLQYLLDGLQ